MITKSKKAKAIERLKRNISIEDVSNEFEIPIPVLEDWIEELDIMDLTVLEANIQAVELISDGEYIEPNILQNALEAAALDVTKHIPLVTINGDMVHANALKLCSEAISKLYTTIILKNNAVITPLATETSQQASAFQKLLQD